MAIKVPVIRNGANGISLFNPFFLKIIAPIPTMAPSINDKNMPINILGKPKRIPKRIANLQSPKPIHAPFDIRNNKVKNRVTLKPAHREFNNKNAGLKIN